MCIVMLRGASAVGASYPCPPPLFVSGFVSDCYHCRLTLSGWWGFGFLRPRFCLPPSDWLHFRHIVRVLLSVSCPPCACGVMWSTSALFGLPEYSQSSCVLQIGQLCMPLFRSTRRRWLRTLNHLAVPVRDVAIVSPP